MRFTSAALTVGLLPALLALPAVTPPAPQAEPVAPQIESIPLVAPAAKPAKAAKAGKTTGTPRAEEAREVTVSDDDTDPFELVGVTWDLPVNGTDGNELAALTVTVRVRTDDGWSEWERLAPMEEAPDDASAEGRAATRRGGTSPLVTDEADGVEVKVTTTGTLPEGLRMDLVDPGESAADAHLTPARPAASAQAAAARPAIISRAAWGADESLRNGNPNYNTTIRSAVIHHTASSNGYTSSGAAAQIRGFYAYHTQSLGWSDIGYHFLVDKWGRIYEGRAGGVERPVVGAHAGGFNTDTFGVAGIGNYEVTGAPAAMVDGLARITAWKLGLHDRDPRGTTQLTSQGGGTSRHEVGKTITADVVAQHKDFGWTSCPGRYLSSQLGTLRTLVDRYVDAGNVQRVAGDTRFSTSVQIGQKSFPDARSVVIVSSDEGRRADGAVAAPFAYRKGAPVLLSSRAGLSGVVIDDIERRGVTRAYLIGGPVSLSNHVVSQLRAAGVDYVERLGGATRYDTAAMVAEAMDHRPWAAFVASGDDRHLIDALAAGGIGAHNQWPVLLTQRDSVPAVTRDALRDLGVSRSFAVGGPIPISQRVVDRLPGGQRIAGNTLYDTAEKLADTFVSVGTDRVVIASGDRDHIIDALGGGTFGDIILLTEPDELTRVTERWLADRGVGTAVVVGGPQAVSNGTVIEISQALKP